MTQPYWTHDTALFEASFPAVDSQPIEVRGKVHQSKETYGEEYARSSPLPLQIAAGKRIVLDIAPYVPSFVPASDERASQPPKSDSITLQKRTTPKHPEQDIGRAKGYYYPLEHLLVIWECSFFPSWVAQKHALLGDPHMEMLWQAIERLLLIVFPDATRLVTLGHDPDWNDDDFQAFLRHLGYAPGERGIFEKTPPSLPEKNSISQR